MIELKHLRKEYGSVIPLKDVNAVIHDGDIISVIGPSGTGKSTLLRCINMLEKPTSGQILIDGVDVTDPKCDLKKIRQKTGMVFQSFNLFGHLTVIENIMIAPVEILGWDHQRAYDEGMRLLKDVGLVDKAMNFPEELSGGQKQRAAIARTLAMNPDAIMLDEPTSALDPAMVWEVQAVIKKLAGMGKTMLIVTHEMNFAKAICNRVFYIDEGGIYEEGPPEQVFDHPQGEKTRRFMQRLNVLELEIHNENYDFLGAMGEIMQFCDKNQIPHRMHTHIQLAFEETVQNLLLPVLKKTELRVTLEYSVEKETAVFVIRYGGEKTDMSLLENELAYNILNGVTVHMQHIYHPEQQLGNEITMCFK